LVKSCENRSDPEIICLREIIKKDKKKKKKRKKLTHAKYIARLAGLPSGLNKRSLNVIRSLAYSQWSSSRNGGVMCSQKSPLKFLDHRRRSRASHVLTAIGLVNGNPSFSTTHRIDVP